MKILITTDSYAPVINGVVTSTLNLYDELLKSGHDVRILTLAPDNISKKEGHVYYMKSFGLSIYPNLRGTVAFWDPLLKELLEWSPDIVHSQCEFFTFVFATRIAKKCHVPIVHTYHTLYEYYTEYFTRHQHMGKKCVKIFSRFVLKHADAVIAPTRKVKCSLVNYGVKQDIAIIPTGVKLERFRSLLTEREKEELRQSLGIEKTDRVILTVGRLAAEKNINEILVNIKKIRKRIPQVKMLIVGDGPERSALQLLVEQLGLQNNVIFTGMVKPEQVKNYYQIGDVFVNASQSETQGLTYVEALANGIPEVCKADPCLEGVIKDGFNGYTYTGEREFIERICKLLSDDELRETLSANARGSCEKFGTEVFGQSIECLYQQIMINGNYCMEEENSDLDQTKEFSFV